MTDFQWSILVLIIVAFAFAEVFRLPLLHVLAAFGAVLLALENPNESILATLLVGFAITSAYRAIVIFTTRGDDNEER